MSNEVSHFFFSTINNHRPQLLEYICCYGFLQQDALHRNTQPNADACFKDMYGKESQ